MRGRASGPTIVPPTSADPHADPLSCGGNVRLVAREPGSAWVPGSRSPSAPPPDHSSACLGLLARALSLNCPRTVPVERLLPSLLVVRLLAQVVVLPRLADKLRRWFAGGLGFESRCGRHLPPLRRRDLRTIPRTPVPRLSPFGCNDAVRHGELLHCFYLHTNLFALPPLPLLADRGGVPTLPHSHYSHDDVAVVARFCYWLGGGPRSYFRRIPCSTICARS